MNVRSGLINGVLTHHGRAEPTDGILHHQQQHRIMIRHFPVQIRFRDDHRVKGLIEVNRGIKHFTVFVPVLRARMLKMHFARRPVPTCGMADQVEEHAQR